VYELSCRSWGMYVCCLSDIADFCNLPIAPYHNFEQAIARDAALENRLVGVRKNSPKFANPRYEASIMHSSLCSGALLSIVLSIVNLSHSDFYKSIAHIPHHDTHSTRKVEATQTRF
jgi:hypothetical protein